jgi:hypothetical protein
MKATVEERLRIQEDIIEIAQLKAAYCRNADCGWNRSRPDAEGVAALFIEDGVWEAGSFGRAEGRKGIFELFTTSRDAFGLHCISNPVIKVNGDEATGEWNLICPGIVGPGNLQIWIGGTYTDRFVRTAEGWRFKHLKVTIAFTSVNEKGFDVNKCF